MLFFFPSSPSPSLRLRGKKRKHKETPKRLKTHIPLYACFKVRAELKTLQHRAMPAEI